MAGKFIVHVRYSSDDSSSDSDDSSSDGSFSDDSSSEEDKFFSTAPLDAIKFQMIYHLHRTVNIPYLLQ